MFVLSQTISMKFPTVFRQPLKGALRRDAWEPTRVWPSGEDAAVAEVHMAHSNWAHFSLGSFIIGFIYDCIFLPNDSPKSKRRAVKQHPDDHVGAELETSRVYRKRLGMVNPRTNQCRI